MYTVYLGRDNSFAMGLLARGKPVSAAAFSRFVLHLTAPNGTVIVIDSNTAPAGTFDTDESGFFYGASVPILRCKLGLGSFGLVADTIYEAYLRLYDALNTNGLVWPEDNQRVRIRILSGP